MGKIIAVVNQKGGVGKTTSAVNLAAAVGQRGKSVLLVDIDPQGNATSGMGLNKRELAKSSYDVIINGTPAKEVIKHTEFDGVDVLPANMNLAGAELELVDSSKRESNLKNALLLVKGEYDFIFMDCPPSLGLITLNALCAADTVLVPIQCEYYALEGLSQLISTVRQVKRLYNPMLEIEGVFEVFAMHEVVQPPKHCVVDRVGACDAAVILHVEAPVFQLRVLPEVEGA